MYKVTIQSDVYQIESESTACTETQRNFNKTWLKKRVQTCLKME